MKRNYIVDQITIENLVKVRLTFLTMGIKYTDSWHTKVSEEMETMTYDFLKTFEETKSKSSMEKFKALLPAFRKNLALVENIRNVFGTDAAVKFFSITANISEDLAREYFEGSPLEYAMHYLNLCSRKEWSLEEKLHATGELMSSITEVKKEMKSLSDWKDIRSVA